MKQLELELSNKEYWEITYNKMVLKQGMKKDDKDLLWKIKEIERTDIINKLLYGTYEWSIPRKVEIAKSESKKKRVVYLYDIRDRYILGVLYRAVSNRYKDLISDSCFSYKKGTSTNDAKHYIKDR